MGETTGKLLDVMSNQHHRFGPPLVEQGAETLKKLFSGSEIESGGWLVETDERRVRDENPPEENPGTLSFREDTQVLPSEMTDAKFDEHLISPPVIALGVLAPPWLECAIDSSEHDLVSREGWAQLASQGRAQKSETRSLRADIERAEPLAKQRDHSSRRPQPAREHREQR